MHIYFSGIGGVGIGPLAEIAADAGYKVSGSDISHGPMLEQLSKRGIDTFVGQGAGHIEKVQAENPIDWLVYTSALPEDHPELQFARSHGIRVSKRDELLAQIITDKKMKLIAVAGTHGKTTTTGMLVWLFKKSGIPLSYSVGATLNFGPSGKYDPDSKYFVYECDEYDRNFLHFKPDCSVITVVDYDHHNTYPSPDEYRQAFGQFIEQSQNTLIWKNELAKFKNLPATQGLIVIDKNDVKPQVDSLKLAGEHNREDAYLASRVMTTLFDLNEADLFEALAEFPGANRRFEKLADNLYTDYGHHPVEVKATLQLAKELSSEVVLVYQPHQNVRQHQVKDQYANCFADAETVYWLPTYLSREDPNLPVLTPEQLTSHVKQPDSIIISDMNDKLWQNITAARAANKLVLVMGAGDIDTWIQQRLLDA